MKSSICRELSSMPWLTTRGPHMELNKIMEQKNLHQSDQAIVQPPFFGEKYAIFLVYPMSDHSNHY
jgi:hypothetical protein